jgi:3-phenylpropionate/trans-cinnamate dioxygenase ferredoxin reductase component
VSEPYALLIVGSGPAGLSAARAFRGAGGSGPVAMISDERRMPYDRPPLSKELLRGELEEDDLPIEEEAWLEAQNVDLISGRAVSLHPSEHLVALSGSRELEYATCVLATGAEPTRLPIPGADHPGVRTLRSLEDLRELQRRLRTGGPVTVIGSGFIGCEIAASLRLTGHPAAIVSDEAAPNVGRLGERAAAEIARWLTGLGVELGLGTAVEAIEGSGDGLRVISGESARTTDVVVMATGVAPRSELAAMAGAELDQGAIAADSGLRTSLDDVLAAGDVCAAVNQAAGRRLHVEHWGDALGQGEVAGLRAAGVDAHWSEVPGFWSTIGEHTLKYAAWGDRISESRFESGRDGAFSVHYGRDGYLVGVLTHENDGAYERGRELIKHGTPWDQAASR